MCGVEEEEGVLASQENLGSDLHALAGKGKKQHGCKPPFSLAGIPAPSANNASHQGTATALI